MPIWIQSIPLFTSGKFCMKLVKTTHCPLDCKIKPVNLKGNQPWIFNRRTDAELQYFGHLMQRANSLENTLMLGKTEGRRRRGQRRTRWLDGITDSTDMSKLWEMVKDREPGECSPWGYKGSDTTEQLNNNTLSISHPLCYLILGLGIILHVC